MRASRAAELFKSNGYDAGEFCALNEWKARGYDLGQTERPPEGPIR